MSKKNNVLIPLYYILSLVSALMFLITLLVGGYSLGIAESIVDFDYVEDEE